MCTHIHACARAHTHKLKHMDTSTNMRASTYSRKHTDIHIIYTNVHTQAQAKPTYTGIVHMHTQKSADTQTYMHTNANKHT